MNLNLRCFYCGVGLTPPPRPGKKGRYGKGFRFPKTMLTWDHVVPRSKGGTRENKVPACVVCNTEKGVLTREEFRILVGYRLNLEGWHAGSHIFAGEHSL